jgi:hypothetical protein
MVATVVLLLIQVPPAAVSANEVVEPTHTSGVPVMAGGKGLTVTSAVIEHPVRTVYVTVIVPGVTPVTTPVIE